MQTVRHGDLTTAAVDVDRALREFGGESVEWRWRFRELKAQILVSQSAPKESLSLLKADLPPSLASTDIAVRKSLLEGIAERVNQNFEESERKLADAENLAESSQKQLLSQVLNAKGALQVDQNRYAEAEATFNRALKLARQYRNPDQEATAQVSLAWVAIKLEHLDEAIDRSRVALELSQSLGMRSFVATVLGNLGWAYSELGDFEYARKFYQQGADASSQSGMAGYSAYWFSGVADSDMALRDYASAEHLAQTTLKRAMELHNAQTTTACLNTLAEVMLRTHRLADAERYNQEALKIEEAGADKFGTPDSSLLAAKIAFANQRFPQADELFRRVLVRPNVETQLRWEAEAGLARVRDAQGRPAEAKRGYVKAIDTIESARQSINHDELRLSFLSSGIQVYGEYVDFLLRHDRPAEALNEAELSRARTLAEGLSSDHQSMVSGWAPRSRPQQIAERMNATLLYYWLGEAHSYLWVITPLKTTLLTLPSALEIDPIVKSYSDAAAESKDVLKTEQAAGEKLYTVLVAPAQRFITPNSRVILFPDGSLYGLNFETLIVPDPKPHYWIEDVTLTTASSMTLLASAAARPAPTVKSLFLVGDTVSPNTDFPALPQAEAEMQRIEKYFPAQRREVLSGAAATPAAYLSSDPEKYAYLHFVTHGTASRARPLESAVILSKEKDEDTYKLYARDIVQRHLSAYLVTISACNGAGTRAYSGEGLVGLSWAFLRAGAHNVIGALWEVSDASTPQLMDTLYNGLSHGEDPASALRAAKLSLLHSDSVFRKPFYWAPFQLYAGS